MSIKSTKITKVILFVLLSTYAVAMKDATSGEGVITDHIGNTLTIKTADGPVTVVVSNETKVQQYTGWISKKDMPDTSLIPGLKLSFEGVRGKNGQLSATNISFYSDDLALAEVMARQ